MVDIADTKEDGSVEEEMKNELLEIMENRLKWIESIIDMHVGNLVQEKLKFDNINTKENIKYKDFSNLKNKDYKHKLRAIVLDEDILMDRKTRMKTA